MTDTREGVVDRRRLFGAWHRLPVAVRAVVEGLWVMAIGVWSWPIVLAVVPVPWSPLVMIGLLWLYWQFFSGRRWRPKTAEIRRTKFRESSLAGTRLRWALAAAGAFVVVGQASFVVTFRLVEFPHKTFTQGLDLGDGQPFEMWMVIVVASLVAGICEETGFRGYMQVPLEGRYRPWMAVTVGSILFVLIHLNQPWVTSIWPHLFGLSVLLGILAYASRSLIPAIVAHVVLDIFNFSYWWTDVAGRFERLPIGDVGIDPHFVSWLIILAVGLGAFVWSIRRLTSAATAPRIQPLPTRT